MQQLYAVLSVVVRELEEKASLRKGIVEILSRVKIQICKPKFLCTQRVKKDTDVACSSEEKNRSLANLGLLYPTLLGQIGVKYDAQACFAEFSSLYQYMLQTQSVEVSALSFPSYHFQISFLFTTTYIFFSLHASIALQKVYATQSSLEIKNLDVFNATSP